MTRIDFYFNVTDKPALTHDLVQAALVKHRQVTITVADETAANDVTSAL